MSDYNFQVDLKGIIRLLSDNLYSSDSVFLRELLQNGIDAIKARKQKEPDFTDGKITVHYTPLKSSANLVFCDNGIGLTEEEIHNFLSVIGQSSKRSEEVRNSFIGQFGIGLLSCFLVTNEIKVITKSVEEKTAFQWVGHSIGTYEIKENKKKMEPGTEVHLKLTGKMYKKFDESKIIQSLKEYGFLIREPICFEGREYTKQINDKFIPWRQEICTLNEMLEFGQEIFEQEFFDVIPISGDQMMGYAFISTHQTSASIVNQHKIYLRDMFITEDGRDLIPKWAFFTQCIINTRNLTPTASREGFSHDAKLLKAKNQIEKSIMNYFISLSNYDVKKLKKLTSIHNVAIKALAVENDKIFQLFFPFLTFLTNKGNLTGLQLLKAAKKVPIYYCAEVDDFRRICPFLENSSQLLVNAGYIYDSNLLQQLPRFHKNIQVKFFEESFFDDLLEEPSKEMEKEAKFFIEIANDALSRFQCVPILKQFSPVQLPTLFVQGDESYLSASLEEEDFSTFLEGFSDDYMEMNSTRLYFNCENLLIQKIVKQCDAELIEIAVQVLYVQALMTGRYTIGANEMEIMNKGLLKLLAYGLGESGHDIGLY